MSNVAATDYRFVTEPLATLMPGIALQKKHLAAIARLQAIMVPEPEVAAYRELYTTWVPRILKAVKRGETSVTNKGWVFGRSDQEYVDALQKILGPPFKAYVDDTVFGGGWTRVCWA